MKSPTKLSESTKSIILTTLYGNSLHTPKAAQEMADKIIKLVENDLYMQDFEASGGEFPAELFEPNPRSK